MRLSMLIKSVVASSVLVATGYIGNVQADAVADFYSGKSISLIIGYGPGGGNDTYSRVLARHLGKHIPGNPTVVPKNMPGAGAIVAANYIFNATPKDGTNLGVFAASAALDPLFAGKKSKAKFKPEQFTWIGNMNKETYTCGVWKNSGINSFDDLVKGKPVIFGSTGPAGTTSQHPRVFNSLAGTNIKVVYGYKGSKDVNLAMRKGEVGGSCGLSESTIRSRWYKDVEKGDLKIIVQMGLKKNAYFGNAAYIFDYAKDENIRKAMKLIFGRDTLGRPLAASPGIPADRTKALRQAFVDTMKDPAYLADAKKAKLDTDWDSGAEVDKMIAEFLATPPKILAVAKDAMARK